MKIVRYLDPSGKILYGAEQPSGKTVRIEGDIFSNFRATDEPAQISKLLAPVAPAAMLADPLLRAQIACFEIDSWAFSLTLERVGDMAKVGQAHPAISSMLKYYGCELNKRRLELMVAAGGSDALEWEGVRSRGGNLARSWLRSKANSIEGGTSEVQLNIIAKRILGLPDA